MQRLSSAYYLFINGCSDKNGMLGFLVLSDFYEIGGVLWLQHLLLHALSVILRTEFKKCRHFSVPICFGLLFAQYFLTRVKATWYFFVLSDCNVLGCVSWLQHLLFDALSVILNSKLRKMERVSIICVEPSSLGQKRHVRFFGFKWFLWDRRRFVAPTSSSPCSQCNSEDRIQKMQTLFRTYMLWVAICSVFPHSGKSDMILFCFKWL